MSRKITYSLLDSITTPAAKRVYPYLGIPLWFPPEGIVLIGWLFGVLGSIALGFSTTYWWAGLIAIPCIAINYFFDLIDGHHARTSGQCRHGGEMLDRFFDFLSFTSFYIGVAFAAQNLTLGIFVVILLNTASVLNKIKDKYTDTVVLGYVGPAEIRTSVMLLALVNSLAIIFGTSAAKFDELLLYAIVLVAPVWLGVKLFTSVREVNGSKRSLDCEGWEIPRLKKAS